MNLVSIIPISLIVMLIISIMRIVITEVELRQMYQFRDEGYEPLLVTIKYLGKRRKFFLLYDGCRINAYKISGDQIDLENNVYGLTRFMTTQLVNEAQRRGAL